MSGSRVVGLDVFLDFAEIVWSGQMLEWKYRMGSINLLFAEMKVQMNIENHIESQYKALIASGSINPEFVGLYQQLSIKN